MINKRKSKTSLSIRSVDIINRQYITQTFTGLQTADPILMHENKFNNRNSLVNLKSKKKKNYYHSYHLCTRFYEIWLSLYRFPME